MATDLWGNEIPGDDWFAQNPPPAATPTAPQAPVAGRVEFDAEMRRRAAQFAGIPNLPQAALDDMWSRSGGDYARAGADLADPRWLQRFSLTNPVLNAASGGGGGTSSTGGRQPGQSFRQYWESLIAGRPVNQQTLLDLEQQLTAAGSRITGANASGERTKIWDPDLQDWVRVGFGEGSWQYIPQGWGQNGPAAGGGGMPTGSLTEPWTTPFQYPSFEAPAAFKAPTSEEAFNDEGFKFTLGQGRQALERSAAARGTLLTTGTLKDLDQFSQGAASQQYDKVYGRRLGEYQMAGGLARQDYARDYDKALGEYRQSYDIFNNNQDRPYSKLLGLAGMGFQGTQSLLGAGQGYAGMYGNTLGNMGAGMGNAYMGGGNAAASGIVGGANSWINGINQGLNFAAPWLYSNIWNTQRSPSLSQWHG